MDKYIPPRLFGLCRKIVLRELNNSVIARFSQRASIGLPFVGFYFGIRAMRSDFNNVFDDNVNVKFRKLYYFATLTDGVDIATQTLSMVNRLNKLHFIDVPEIVHYMPYIDTVGWAAAISSSSIVSYIFFKKQKK